jgi:hypothetical protein
MPAAIGECDEHPVHITGAYKDLIMEINALEQYFVAAPTLAAAVAGGGMGVPHVTFGASPIRRDYITPTTHPSTATTNSASHGDVANPMDEYGDFDMGNELTME